MLSCLRYGEKIIKLKHVFIEVIWSNVCTIVVAYDLLRIIDEISTH